MYPPPLTALYAFRVHQAAATVPRETVKAVRRSRSRSRSRRRREGGKEDEEEEEEEEVPSCNSVM